MEFHQFNSIMAEVHENWAAKALKMKRNENKGPDLYDNIKIAEVKSCLYPNKKNYVKWNIIEHQMNYPKFENKPGFWVAGTYSLSLPVLEIKTKDIHKLENFVINRDLYILPWSWANQFNPSETSGETKLSKWNWTFRYSKGNKLPEIIEKIETEKGKIFFTKGVNLNYFKNVLDNEKPYL